MGNRAHCGTAPLTTNDGLRVLQHRGCEVARRDRVARAVEAAFESEGITVLQANRPAGAQTVPHFHMHVVPRHTGDGLVITWPVKHPPSEELAAYAQRIKPE